MITKHIHTFILLAAVALLLTSCGDAKTSSESTKSNTHPRLLLSSNSAHKFRQMVGTNALFDQSFSHIKDHVDSEMEKGFVVPVPKDAGGGYTHEVHKKNGILMYEAGILYQITGEKKYAEFVEKMLLEYAKLYPTLGLHPKRKEQSPGKLFWQGLNESMWVVYTIQGYDFVYNALSEESRKKIEEGVFGPVTHFLMVDSEYMFNRIHNHGTWATAAVGMTGYVLGDDEMVEKSLRGSNKDGKGGFLIQLDKLFSPDGYYTEGPYYQRFALLPFIVFAEAIDKNDPELHIFAYNDSILGKAVNTALQLTYTNGAFFPINDALKEKTYETIEMVYAANIAYAAYGHEPGLLDISQRQGRISITDAGLEVAKDWKAGKTKPYNWHSTFLTDGAKGDKGGIGILRAGSNEDQSCLLMKYTSHGLGHGHFDKLGFLYYDKNDEVIRDYGAARFLNIEAKYGGRYLPEDNLWAKQTIAHNTLTVDETSDFEGDKNVSSKHNPTPLLFSGENEKLQYMSAVDTDAYPGVKMHRTMIMAEIPSLEYPVVIDIFNITANKKHQYDLPFYYKGQFISTNFEVKAFTQKLEPLGKQNGYQFLWLKGKAKVNSGNARFTWLNNNRFYTLTMLTNAQTEILFTTIGANDPNFNLRNESAIMLRQPKSGNHLFVNIIEPHGEFNPIAEYTINAVSKIKEINAKQSGDELIVDLELFNGERWQLKAPASTVSTNGTVTLTEINQ